jgi:hypothetical protein
MPSILARISETLFKAWSSKNFIQFWWMSYSLFDFPIFFSTANAQLWSTCLKFSSKLGSNVPVLVSYFFRFIFKGQKLTGFDPFKWVLLPPTRASMVSYRSGPKVKTFFEGEIFFMPRDWVLRDRVLGSWISVWAMRAESKIISGKFLGFF